jgi:dienelactone hydrolase
VNIIHEKNYPTGPGPFPGIISLHASGGFQNAVTFIENFRSETWVKAGYAWYAPNFFEKHGITPATRMDTFDKYREDIEKELAAIITLMKADPKIDSKNIFAIGFSNGGFWTSYLTGKDIVTAAASHYGVWKANGGRDWTNPYPMEYFSSKSSPLLALHGEDDDTQKIKYFYEAWSQIKDTPKIEEHVYSDAGHVWDCFPILATLKKVCEQFEDPNREVTDDALKRTLAFFKKHTK